MCSRSGSPTTRWSSRGRARISPQAASWVGEHGGVAYLAHPYWTGDAAKLELPDEVSGIEVYNAGCELEVGRGLSSVHWDDAARDGAPVLRHRRRRLAPSRVRQRPRLDLGAGARAVAGGGARRRWRPARFYSSTGPAIHASRSTTARSRCAAARAGR